MRFSRRLPEDLSPSPLASVLAGVPDAVDLTAANPTLSGLAWPDAGELLAVPGAGRYEPHPLGLPSARAAVAQDVSEGEACFASDRLLLTASTSEAYSLLLKLLCDPGDIIAVPAPSYPLVEVLGGLELVELCRYRLDYRGRWRPDLESAERALRGGARAVVVVQPNNPTGSCFTAEEIAALDALCAEHGAAIIADEVFRRYPFGASPLPTFAGPRRSLTFVLDGLSKGAGLPQLKVGWVGVFGPEDEVRQAMVRLEYIADAYLSVATPVQLALEKILGRAAPVRERIRARVRENRRVVGEAVSPLGPVEVLAAEGGWSAVLQVPAGLSDDDLVTRIAEDARVIVHPGYFYDFAHDGYLVLGLLAPPDVFAPAVARMTQVLRRALA